MSYPLCSFVFGYAEWDISRRHRSAGSRPELHAEPMTLELSAVWFGSTIVDLATDLFSRTLDPLICNIRLTGASLELVQGPIIGLAPKLRM